MRLKGKARNGSCNVNLTSKKTLVSIGINEDALNLLSSSKELSKDFIVLTSEAPWGVRKLKLRGETRALRSSRSLTFSSSVLQSGLDENTLLRSNFFLKLIGLGNPFPLNNHLFLLSDPGTGLESFATKA